MERLVSATDDGDGSRSSYNLPDALAVATYLNIFIRNCGSVRIANLAQMVNAIAPIFTSADAVAVQPIYYPVLLHARAALDVAVDVHVSAPMVNPLTPDTTTAGGRTGSRTWARSPWSTRPRPRRPTGDGSR